MWRHLLQCTFINQNRPCAETHYTMCVALQIEVLRVWRAWVLFPPTSTVYTYIYIQKNIWKLWKQWVTFALKNISLAVMMKKIMELSANSNCILFFFPRSGVQNDSGYKKQNKTKTCNQLLTSHLAQLIFLVSNYQKMLQSNNWKMIRGRLLGELRYKNMAVCRKWFDKGYYE